MQFITFELKVRAGQPAGSTNYKKYVRVFEEGSPQQWIELMQDVKGLRILSMAPLIGLQPSGPF